jgi:hypothetical protein
MNSFLFEDGKYWSFPLQLHNFPRPGKMLKGSLSIRCGLLVTVFMQPTLVYIYDNMALAEESDPLLKITCHSGQQ